MFKWDSLQAVTPGTSGSPGLITRDSAWTIVVASAASDSMHTHLQLPTGCDVGDVVEVHVNDTVGTNQVRVAPPSGEALINGNPDLPAPNFFRKIDTSVWSIN